MLAGLFFLVWLPNVTSAGESTARKRPRRLAAAAGIGLGLPGLVVSTTLPAVLPVFRCAPPRAVRDRHLRARPATLLDGPASPYPDVLFESRRP